MDNNLVSKNGLSVKKFIPGIIWFLLTLTAISIPGYDLPEVDNWLIEINYDKLIHVGLFAVLAFLFMYPVIKSNLVVKLKWRYIFIIAIACIVWGFCTELIQKFLIPGRSYSLSDWLADGLGAVVAVIFVKLKFLKQLT
ncbi:MAG TPA: VanZ family protein [Ferruginibacter sp.]|nr:VanZ family protein [Ferruginibacter sp.]